MCGGTSKALNEKKGKLVKSKLSGRGCSADESTKKNMPKRTNDFQQLVDLLQRALAPKGAKITSSAMVPGSQSGNLREIDVLIETKVGPYNMKIAVEAKDHKRKLNVNDIEALIGKYFSGDFHVNHVVIVAHCGFTEGAQKKAAANNVELKTLTEANKEDWTTKIPQSINFKIEPHIVGIQLMPPDILPSDDSLLCKGAFFCKCCGKKSGTPQELAHRWVFHNPELMKQIYQQGEIKEGGVCARIEIGIPEKLIFRFGGSDYPITAMQVHLHYIEDSSPMSSEIFRFDDKCVHYSTADVAGKKFEMVFPDGLKSKQIAVRITSLKKK